MVKKARIRQARDRRRSADLRQRQARPLMPRRQRRHTLFRRKKMVEHYRKNKKYLSEKESAHCVARQYGCSASLVRHYDRLWRRKGLSGLMPRSRAPHHPRRHLTMETIGLIVAIRVLTGWGAQRIARNLKVQSQGQVVVSHTSVWRVICRHHLPRRVNHPRGKCDGIAYHHYQRRTRNSLWHIDFKTTDELIPGVSVAMMVVIDDATRYCLAAQVRLGHPNSSGRARYFRTVLSAMAAPGRS